MSNSYGMNQQQGIQTHTASADVHTEDLTRKDPGGTPLRLSDCELGLS